MKNKENNLIAKNNIPSWNLSNLYFDIDDKNITKDIEKIKKDSRSFYNEFQGKIKNLDVKNFYLSIKKYEDISEKIGKISTYAYLIYASDLSNQKHISFYQNIQEILSKIELDLVFFTLEINKIDDKKIANFISNPSVKKYQSFIKNTRLFKNYQLSDELEKFSLEKNITGRSAFIRLFDETVNNLKFQYSNKNLNSQQIFDLLNNEKEETRKVAAKSIGKTFQENAKIFAFTTNILAKDKAVEDSWRGFKNPISSRNLSNFIEDEIVEVLVKKIKENYIHTSHRYYKIKAKILGKKFLNYWDRNAPINKVDNKAISWQDAKNLVLCAYEEFSPTMKSIAEKFFDNNWIDAKVKSGKDSGAFSHPSVPSSNPYILMNYQGKVRDVMTLAHELGHGVHQYLARSQGYLQSSTPLTMAETASVFGEQLTFQKILQTEKNPMKKNFIIANKVEDMLNTAIRQIAFLEFETKIHNERKNGEIPLEKICQFWMDVQRESLGSIFKFDDEYKFFWCYIPHFIHSPFYVYSYAFGECLVNSLYGIYKSNKIKNFEEKYLEMLRLGGSKHHSEMLKPFNISIKNNQFWQSGIDVIINYINQIES